MNFRNVMLAGAMMLGLGAGVAQADIVDEVRLGVTAHNICVIDCDNADKEDGPNVSAEVVFETPDFLSWALNPRPYLGTSINTAGKTSFYGGGLQWSFPIGDGFAIEPGLGYFLHDGATSDPFPQGSPESFAFTQENVLLGSEDLFRTSLALSWYLSESWGAQIMYEHYSHGQILGDGRNQGMDNLGVRLMWVFD
mgnify:CR=1 FL=1|tara:strand:+ start:23225 stop:23809 length:585 start_codon:yes stop_codon:yes gene_type:complete